MLGQNNPYRCNPNIWIHIALEDFFHQQAGGNTWWEGKESAEKGELWLASSELIKAIFALTLPSVQYWRLCTTSRAPSGELLCSKRLWKLVKTQLPILTVFNKTVYCWLQASFCTCPNKAILLLPPRAPMLVPLKLILGPRVFLRKQWFRNFAALIC